jgi:hypothetical protein
VAWRASQSPRWLLHTARPALTRPSQGPGRQRRAAAAPLIRQLGNREMVVPLTVVLWVTHPDLGAALFAAPVTALVLVCGLVRVELLASAPI